MLKKIYYVILALALVSSTSMMHAAVNVSTGTMTAQQSDIATGKVVDKNGEGIVGVGIIVKGTTNGT
jgi:hypothetical protein